MDDLLLGIDIGTTNAKAVLLAADGRIIAYAEAQYPTSQPQPGWVEQDPEDWWRGVCTVVRRALHDASAAPGQVRAIGVSGQGCAVTLIDGRGAVVRPALIWMDNRSEPQCESLRQRCADRILALNGKSPAPYNSDPKLMWLREHDPHSLDRAQVSLTTTAYITFRLTGEPVANESDASILFAYDLARGDWSDELIAAFGLPRRLYPRVARGTDVIGTLTAQAAEALGLVPGIAVVAGGEDTSSAALALGAVTPGQTTLSLGTAGTIYVVQDQPAIHPQLLAFSHVVPGETLLGGSTIAVGAALEWYHANLAESYTLEDLTALAAQASVGAGGLIFLPYLNGELQPINDGNARGLLFGLHLGTSRADISRAVLEGAAFAMAHNLSIAAQVGSPITELRAVGGPTRSALWCQIIADVTGQPMSVLTDNPGAPLGDALLAGVGAGLFPDLKTAAGQFVRVFRRYDPDPRSMERYAELFEIYTQLYGVLKPEFRRLAQTAASKGKPTA